MKRYHRALVILLGILLLAFALRMVRIQRRSLWYDEAIAVMHASLSPAEFLYGTVTPVEGGEAANVHPPLYFLLLHGWIKVAGRSPLAIRFLSVGFGMLTVALLWRLASRCFDRRVGRMVGLLAAANPFHVAYSQETRMYALLALTTVTAAWAFLRALDGAGSAEGSNAADGAGSRFTTYHRRWWLLYAVAAALTMYTQNLGAFPLLALNLLALMRRRWRRRLPSLIAANLIAVLLYSPWLVGALPRQLRSVGGGYWLEAPGGAEIVRAAMLPVFTYYEPAPFWLLGAGFFVGLLILVMVFLQVLKTRSRARWFLFLGWAPIILMFVASLWQPVYLERALLPTASFYLVAVGWLLARGALPGPIRIVLLALLLATTAGFLWSHATYIGFPRPPFPEAVAYLEEQVAPGDVVIHTNKLTYIPVYYYAPHLAGEFLSDPPGSPQDTLAQPTQESLGISSTDTITQAVGSAEGVWLIMFEREVAEVEAAGATHPVLSWMEAHFDQSERQTFVDLTVTHYRREVP